MRGGTSRSDLLIWLVSACLAATAAVVWWPGLALPQVEPHLWWPVLAVLFALAERYAVHLPFGRDNHSLTFDQAPLVLGLFLLPLEELLLAVVVGVLLAYVVLHRVPAIKATFNVGSGVAQVAVAAVVFIGMLDLLEAEASDLGPATWAAALAATVAADLVSNVVLSAVIGIRQSSWDLRGLLGGLPRVLIGTVVATDLALVTVLLLRRDPAALVLLAVAGLLCALLYRGYHVQRLRYSRLDLLYRFNRSVDQALRDESVPETVGAQARELMRARHAGVILLDGGDDERSDEAWWGPALTGTAVRLPRGGDGELHRALRAAGHVDGMATPLRDGGQTIGVLVVADRLDDISTFDEEDARLFEALAGITGVAIANSSLVARVRAAAEETEHLALHDPLTGLPNRLLFQQRLEQRLERAGPVAVLLMDVDRFKEVNDTLGHWVGDRLLQDVAERLRGVETDDTVVARLGGDEFAILLGGEDVHVEGMVSRVRTDISRPFRLVEVTLDVDVSIGIAVSPIDGTSAVLLLRRAEVAMYDAKVGLTGVARYSADRDPHSSRRLSLTGDLGRALEDDALRLHYQPQADPVTGQVTCVEALLRWTHPVWGEVSPEEFVPLAEHTGLIRALTGHVVQTAVRQCVAWRQAGTPVQVAVNISARNLLEPDLPDTVARALVQAGLPAAMLKLEVTESAIVADPARALHALERLVELGLSVAVDDFGTGYSSMTRLRSLPVHEVKIDRTFVRHVADEAADLAIVRAVVNLGHDLGLTVVAEGVEDQAGLRVLQDLGCDLVQGYLLARPMAAGPMTEWLRERMASLATPLRPEHAPAALPVVDAPPAPLRSTGRRRPSGA